MTKILNRIWIMVLACGLLLVFSFSVRFSQYLIDQGYNKGRAMERVCQQSIKDNVPLDCTEHNQNTGHILLLSIHE